ncbi:GTPase of the mitochondrial inner membrane that associates with the large ribosomal subunit [Bachmanniomyces sp. S44760]|nr:GTPase of the mitochondrial inner membrane that associates with the large ribosomal subunit [Bachmanniomyces sp. S44760]
MSFMSASWLPFLYPCLQRSNSETIRKTSRFIIQLQSRRRHASTKKFEDDVTTSDSYIYDPNLNPPPEDYGRTIFADKCTLALHAGSGGHGCVSFLREKFVEAGSANGGDGGSGGNVYIQAVRGETSLHKLARRGILRAGRGKNGQGKSKGGQRGADVLIQVPVGTVVREVSRFDPVAAEEEKGKLRRGSMQETDRESLNFINRDKWILYPSAAPSEYTNVEFPPLPRSRKSNLALSQPLAPINLDLSEPMEQPMLLAAGATGGVGNPHFVSRDFWRPKFATKGEAGMSLTLELELKLLADVGFVGLPNAGKSTLLRALSNSRARIGNWAFTTLQPNIGTVVLDNSRGRPKLQAFRANGEPRTQFSIADIPGLVPEAHLDRGLGLGFLRHVERARVLAFVVDLSTGDVTESLKDLWKELRAFENLRDQETNTQTEKRIVNWSAFGSTITPASPEDAILQEKDQNVIINASGSQILKPLDLEPISSKPWFVVATKADLPNTSDSFAALQAYLHAVSTGRTDHPCGKSNCWKGNLSAIPVSGIREQGVEKVAEWTVSLLSSD